MKVSAFSLWWTDKDGELIKPKHITDFVSIFPCVSPFPSLFPLLSVPSTHLFRVSRSVSLLCRCLYLSWHRSAQKNALWHTHILWLSLCAKQLVNYLTRCRWVHPDCWLWLNYKKERRQRNEAWRNEWKVRYSQQIEGSHTERRNENVFVIFPPRLFFLF